MKKFGLLFTLISTSVIANELPQTNTQEHIDVSKNPMLRMEVFKQNSKTKEMTIIEGRKISRSKKDQHLCWIAFNLPINSENNVVEILNSPKPARFSDKNSLIEYSEDKKKIVIRSVTKGSNNHKDIQRCWQFEPKDPIGKYTLQVYVNDVEYPVLTFNVIK